MKRKLLALLLAFAMTVALAVPAFAAGTTPASGTTQLLPLGITDSSIAFDLKPGDVATLSAVNPDGSAASVVWSSADTAVASVSGGVVTGAALGHTVITATAPDGQKASCTVYVAKKGIDVSSYQGSVDWAAVKASGVDFAILRTGYGDENPAVQTDAYFSANYDGATSNGVKVGAYHASYATTPEAALREAQLCLSILNGRHLDYPVFFDVEQSAHAAMTSDQLAAVVSAFCGAVTAAGYRAGIYSSANMYNSNLNSAALNGYDKWVAHHDVVAPNFSGAHTMWQYTSTGSVPGIAGSVDLDYSYQDYPNVVQPGGPIMPISPVVLQTAADNQILSDTPFAISLKAAKGYQFKFTPNGVSGAPKFSIGNAGVAKVVSVQKTGNSYYVKIAGVKAGTTSVYSTLPGKKAVARCVVTVG